MIAALLIAAWLAPAPAVVEDRCEVIEVNTVLNEYGKELLTQYIFWDYEEPEGRYHVRAWRMFSGNVVRTNAGYVAVFADGGVVRRVAAPYYKSTVTWRDVEIDERDVRANDKRRELWKW